MFKDLIKELISKNSKINSFVYETFSKSKTREMLALYDEIKNWDTIEDIKPLKKFRQQVEQGRSYFTTDPNLSNFRIYGNWYSVFGKFLDDYSDIIQYPSLEHGLIFHNQIFTDVKYTARPTVATFSSFRKKIIHQYLSRPVFCVGPYVHYATGFYSKQKIDELRKKNGKTLLVFPVHSTNTSEITLDQTLFLEKVRQIAKNYSHVIVNAFWWNINDLLIDKLESEGYQIVSAGYRDDIQFLNRLKSIIQLSDFAIGDSVGSHIGYCVSEKVPFAIINTNTEVKLKEKAEQSDLGYVKSHTKIIKEAFLNAHSITSQQIEICNKYWGLNEIKSDEELKEIIEISKLIFKISKGNLFAERSRANQVLHIFDQQKNITGYEMLKDALLD